jgi:V/A-type H+-transporting ATPase subunit D
MALENVTPTRSELIDLKKKIKLSERGYNILKMKRDGLIIEFFRVLEDAKQSRGTLLEKYEHASEAIRIANTMEGAIGVKAAAMAVQKNPQITLKQKNIMGVVVPVITASAVRKDLATRGYGLIGTSSVIDETAVAYEELVEEIVKAAEIETTIKRLLDDIESTKRRVNALEFKVIPELKEAANFIKMRLDQMESEETSRLKKIKARASK